MKRVPWLIVGVLAGSLAVVLFGPAYAQIRGYEERRELIGAGVGFVIGLTIEVILQIKVRWRRR